MSPSTHVSLFDDRTHRIPNRTAKLTLDEFVAWLRRNSRNEIDHKRSNRLVTTAKFEGPRCLANVETINGLWLDNDDGNPKPEELLDLFPGLRMVIFNTYSTRADLPRYRAFIPTAQSMTADDYARLWSGFIARVNAVYPKHGFDPAPKHAAAIFYAPCQPHSGEPSDAFFIDRPGKLLNIADYMMEDLPAAERVLAPAGVSIELIQNELVRIRSDDRSTWFSVLCALHHELGQRGKELGRRWSMTSRKYDAQEFERTWRSIVRGKPRRPITIATVFHLAKATQTVPANFSSRI